MKAVRYHEYGDASVLRHEEVERPTAGPGQVLLQVAGTAFNPVDVAIRAGYLSQGLPLSFPHVPGFDVAGTVVELGEGVRAPRLGDEVIAFLPMDRDGAAAEYVVTAVRLWRFGLRNNQRRLRLGPSRVKNPCLKASGTGKMPVPQQRNFLSCRVGTRARP